VIRQMQIPGRRLQRGVSQVLLQQPQIDSRFEQMSRVTVTQTMHADVASEFQIHHWR